MSGEASFQFPKTSWNHPRELSKVSSGPTDVGATGIEPAARKLRVSCSTTELRTHMFTYVFHNYRLLELRRFGCTPQACQPYAACRILHTLTQSSFITPPNWWNVCPLIGFHLWKYQFQQRYLHCLFLRLSVPCYMILCNIESSVIV